MPWKWGPCSFRPVPKATPCNPLLFHHHFQRVPVTITVDSDQREGLPCQPFDERPLQVCSIPDRLRTRKQTAPDATQL